MSKRFSSALELMHAFVHKTHDVGYSTNTHFVDGVLYSYETPIAAIVNELLILTTQNYSATTIKHKSKLRDAAHNVRSIIEAPFVPNQTNDVDIVQALHKKNIDFMERDLAEKLQIFVETTRSRTMKARNLIAAFNLIDNYSNTFNVDWNNHQIIYQTVKLAEDEVAQYQATSFGGKPEKKLNPNKNRVDYESAVAESVRKWRMCETNVKPLGASKAPPILRVNAARIETSHSASMPSCDAAKAWPEIKKAFLNIQSDVAKDSWFRDRVSSFRRTELPHLRFGLFRSASVTQYDVTIGCHKIPWEEIVSVAKQLNLDVSGLE